MHLFQGFRAENARAVVLAAFQMRNHEMRHIDAAGREAPGGRRDYDFIGLRGLRSERVPWDMSARERRRQRLPEGGVRHFQRFEQVRINVVIERLP